MGEGEKSQCATHGIQQKLGSAVLLAPVDFHPRSSLVFTARCLSSSATVSSAIWLICFSISLMVSSETVYLDFFSLFIELVRTFRKESLALLVFCLASFTSISLCSLVTWGMGTRISVPSTSGFRFIPLSLIALIAAAVHSGKLAIFTKISCGDFMEIWLIWFKASFPSAVTTAILSRDPGEVLILRVLLKLSLSASITDFISSFTSSKLIISSTKAALIFTLVWDCPFPLALAFLVAKWRTGTAE
uniref:RNA binding motif protein 18 n=1 Tax=Pan troglodytes TaxID=9598 RepID=K7C0Z1_PANTR